MKLPDASDVIRDHQTGMTFEDATTGVFCVMETDVLGDAHICVSRLGIHPTKRGKFCHEGQDFNIPVAAFLEMADKVREAIGPDFQAVHDTVIGQLQAEIRTLDQKSDV